MDSKSLLIMDYISESPSSILLLESDDAESIFNKPAHNLKGDALVGALQDLRKKGFINVRSEASSADLKLDLSNIEKRRCIVYLTASGGEAWEKVFKPDWSKYLGISVKFGEYHEYIKFESLQRDKLLSVVDLVSPRLLKRKRIRKRRCWHATYWKIFDVGYVLDICVPVGVFSDEFFLSVKEEWKKNYESTKRNDCA